MPRLGIVGLGNWGWNLGRAFAEMKECRLLYCCDSNHKRSEAFEAAYPHTKAVPDFDALLSKELDAVVIATPAVTHYELARKALLARRDVFVEKPLTLSVREAEELLTLADARHRVLMVGHILLFHPVLRHLRKIIQSGDLGSVYYLTMQRVNLGRIRGDENVLWSFAPHDISQALYLLDDEPVEVAAQGQSYIQQGIEDVVFLGLSFANRAMAHIHVSWLDPHKIRRVTVVGSKKMAVFDDIETTEKLRIYDRCAHPPQVRTYGDAIQLRFGDILIPRVEMAEPLKLECRHFCDCLESRESPITDGRNGLKILRILDAAQRSLQLNGVPQNIYAQPHPSHGQHRHPD
ncbi:MAG: Gfo/Idh/MocA family oxidoreductase [Elusimicrobia bacterium]|nr:Gfo/Idh/MocA family oxidoreductase [Elusimicrobiota bacterium]